MRFVDYLSSTNISIWQMLPITPPDFYGSPYASSSAFAGCESLIAGGEDISMEEESPIGSKIGHCSKQSERHMKTSHGLTGL